MLVFKESFQTGVISKFSIQMQSAPYCPLGKFSSFVESLATENFISAAKFYLYFAKSLEVR